MQRGSGTYSDHCFTHGSYYKNTYWPVGWGSPLMYMSVFWARSTKSDQNSGESDLLVRHCGSYIFHSPKAYGFI